MSFSACKITRLNLGKLSGASPSLNQYYVVVMFDISNAKKYRMLVKVLKRFGTRVQKSVFEAWLTKAQISDMERAVRRLMTSEKYFNEYDRVRIYRIAGNCEMIVYGDYVSNVMQENIIL